MSKFASNMAKQFLRRGLKEREAFHTAMDTINYNSTLRRSWASIKPVDRYRFQKLMAFRGYAGIVRLWEVGREDMYDEMKRCAESTYGLSFYHKCIFGSGISKRVLQEAGLK